MGLWLARLLGIVITAVFAAVLFRPDQPIFMALAGVVVIVGVLSILFIRNLGDL